MSESLSGRPGAEGDVSAPSSAVSAAHEPIQHLDGRQLKQAFEAALHWLERHAPAINASNVFPVPDGDTGDNMLMTMRSAMRAVADQTTHNATEIAQLVAQGALRGARGNSGVILSQILRGFAAAEEAKEHFTARDLARAFRRASASAYSAVMKPMEGTILTVARAMAEGAEEAAHETADIREQIHRTTAAARQALQRTPELLPILKEAGVVDSGGQGLVAILEGMSRYLRGESTHTPQTAATVDESVAPLQGAADVQALLEAPPPPLAHGRYGYDIQYLIRGEDLDVDAIRAHIGGLGDCALVVGDDALVKVHVHALTPGPALDYGAALGALDDIVVENMDLQYAAFAQPPKTEEDEESSRLSTEDVTGVGIVAVAAGAGLEHHFRELGASAVVQGGQTMNPSTQDLLDAIQSLAAREVILLPNNKNIIMAAQQAQKLARCPVHVVPTRSAPQGFAALLAFDYSADAATNAAGMAAALDDVLTGEITQAVRTTTINGLDVAEGDTIGLLEGQLVAVGPDDRAVAGQLLAQIDLDVHEIVGVYYGEDRSAHDAEQLVAALEREYPDLEFEVQAGGQPHYSYLLAIE